MDQAEKSKKFIKRYHREISYTLHNEPELFQQTLDRYIIDQKLINHILFFKKSFPGYKVIVKDMMAEGNRVFVKVDFLGKHTGIMDDIPSTDKEVEVPFAICYTVKNDKIVDFWAIANEMEFFEQLGLTRDEVDIPKL